MDLVAAIPCLPPTLPRRIVIESKTRKHSATKPDALSLVASTALVRCFTRHRGSQLVNSRPLPLPPPPHLMSYPLNRYRHTRTVTWSKTTGEESKGRATGASAAIGGLGDQGRGLSLGRVSTPLVDVRGHRLRRAEGEGAVSSGQEHAVAHV